MLRFRGSIQVDLYIQEPKDLDPDAESLPLEEGREKAQEELDGISQEIPNSYTVGVATIQEIIQGEKRI